MYAVAKREVRAAKSLEEVFRQSGNAQKRGFQDFRPILGRIGRSDGRARSAGHFVLSPGAAEDVVVADD